MMSAKAKDDNSTGFDLQTKLLGGAVVGLGVGLIGIFYGLSSGDKVLSLAGYGALLFG